MLMEDSVTYRRELPLRKAEALRARMEVLEDVRERLHKNRSAMQESEWGQEDASPPPLPFQEIQGGQEQVRWALGNAVAQIIFLLAGGYSSPKVRKTRSPPAVYLEPIS